MKKQDNMNTIFYLCLYFSMENLRSHHNLHKLQHGVENRAGINDNNTTLISQTQRERALGVKVGCNLAGRGSSMERHGDAVFKSALCKISQ